jgi:hypothetical protein
METTEQVSVKGFLSELFNNSFQYWDYVASGCRSNAVDSYLGDAWFDSWLGHWLSWLKFYLQLCSYFLFPTNESNASYKLIIYNQTQIHDAMLKWQ